MMSLEDELRELIRREARAVFEEMFAVYKSHARPALDIGDKALATIRDYEIIGHKPYLTKAEAATYLDVSEKSIEEWSARSDDCNPFPEDRAASSPRYNRMKIDAWVEREARRRREARA